jgi:hypothetical protein
MALGLTTGLAEYGAEMYVTNISQIYDTNICHKYMTEIYVLSEF